MPITWWKSGSSSSPASPSRSPAERSGGGGSGRDVVGLLFRRRDPHQPRLTRKDRLRGRLSDIDVRGAPAAVSAASTPVSRTGSGLDAGLGPPRSSSSPVLQGQPQPLPLPDYASASPGRPLPSQKDITLTRPEVAEGNGSIDHEQIGERLSSASVLGSRLVYRPTQRNTEYVSGASTRSKFTQYCDAFDDSNSPEMSSFRLNALPIKSAPNSGLSSPVHSPRRSNPDYFSLGYHTSQGVQNWSAPDMPLIDMMVASPEKMLASPDCSPLYSPRKNTPISRSRNPSAPASPRHPIMLTENISSWHDINGHPLPLPPVPLITPQSGFTHQAPVKSEVNTMTNQWQKGKLIGSGTFGRVYLATNRHTGALCAMKEVNIIPDDPKSAECLKQLEQEIKLLSKLKHPNIVQYYGSEMIEDQFYIYLEYVFPGSIQNYVRDRLGAMTESIVRNFTRHILSGLAYLHSTVTMHRDIKGANLLVDAHGVVKLADFGMAKHLSGATDALSLKGTPFWMAPEVVQATMNKEIGYDLAVDIWSLGCTIIEMFTGKHPWSGLEGAAAMFKVLHKDPPIPESLSPEGKDFLQKCFRRNPADRPAASTLLEHPFVQNSNHYNLQPHIQSFTGIKLTDNVFSPRDGPSKRESVAFKVKQLNGETSHSHSEIRESVATRTSLRPTFEVVPCTIPQSPFNHLGPNNSNSSLNGLSGTCLANAFHRPHVLPSPAGRMS